MEEDCWITICLKVNIENEFNTLTRRCIILPSKLGHHLLWACLISCKTLVVFKNIKVFNIRYVDGFRLWNFVKSLILAKVIDV